MGMVGVPMRQETARAAIAERLARSKHLLGALLWGPWPQALPMPRAT